MLREALWNAALLRRFSGLTTDDTDITDENNDETRMTKLEGMMNDEIRRNVRQAVAWRRLDETQNAATRKLLRHLVIVSGFDIRASSFSSVSIRG